MRMSYKTKALCGISAALALMSPTAAAASGSNYSPMVALSMVAAPQSQTALCSVGMTEAANAAAESASGATQAPPAQGCVLPVAEAAPVAPLPAQAAVARAGFSPLLIGLGAIGLGVLLYAVLHNDKNQPPPQPVSPA